MELKELIDNQYNSLDKKEGSDPFRKLGYENFLSLGIPTAKHEEWKYADFSRVLKSDFSFNVPSLSKADIQSFLFEDLDAHLVVLVNGHYSSELSNTSVTEGQVTIKNFADAKSEIKDKLNAYADSKNNPFASLSAALATSGVYIEVPNGKVVSKPILILNISDKRGNNTLSLPRNFVTIGKNAQVKIVEAYFSIGAQEAFTNGYTEIYAATDSNSEYYKLQLQDDKSSIVDTTQIIQEEKSTFTCFTISLSGNMVRNNLNFVLNGEYCEGNMNGLSLLKGTTLVDNHTSVDHAYPNSVSNELYKNILDEKATGVFNGKIFVRKDAQKTNAYQSNKNLVISEDAVMNTKPQLEIWADDVKCSHGATIGKMDKDMLFYLNARGIGEQAARAILMNAFAYNVLEKISLEPVRRYLDKLIAKRVGLEI